MANEKRLIDANAFRDWLSKQKRIGKNLVIMMLDETPTVDAVEVVRCKDCKNRGDEDGGLYLCLFNGVEWNEGNHFCAYGKRRDRK